MRWLQEMSFDAPIVATVWCALLMRAKGVQNTTALVCLGIVVWGVYLLDRWLDGQRRHTEAIPIALALGAGAVCAMALPRILLVAGMALGTLVAVYLIAVHHSVQRVLIVKEILVGITFAMGTWLPVASLRADWHTLAGCLAFACVCTLNCVTCEWGARQAVRGRWRKDAASVLGPKLAPLSAVTAAVLLLFAGEGAIFAACGISALLLLIVNLRAPGTALGTRLWADAAMLSPILFLVR